MIYAELLVPGDLKSPESRPDFEVREEIGEQGAGQFVFSMLWVGSKGSAEYNEWAEETLRQLQDRVVEKCLPQ